jgi:rubrerythrin
LIFAQRKKEEDIVGDKNVVDKKPVEPTAQIVQVVTDDGQFGTDYCRKCGKEIKGLPEQCPFCGVKLIDSYVSRAFDGSDY